MFTRCSAPSEEMAALTRQIDALVEAYRSGRALALLLDFDGTLVPIASHPDHAILDSETRCLLERLSARPRVIVGILSGRAIDDLKQKIGTSAFCLVGTSGLEMEWRGKRTVPNQAGDIRRLMSDIMSRLSPLIARFPGIWIEEKPFGLTLHYRHLTGHTVEEFIAAQREKLGPIGRSIDVAAGPWAIEIMPAVGQSKGTAVERICASGGRDVMSFFAGDGDNDGPAFQSVRKLGGVAVGVGPDVQFPVDARIADPARLVAGLHYLFFKLCVVS